MVCATHLTMDIERMPTGRTSCCPFRDILKRKNDAIVLYRAKALEVPKEEE